MAGLKSFAVLMGNQKKVKYLVAANYKKKANNIIIEHIKRPKIEERHKLGEILRISLLAYFVSEGINRFAHPHLQLPI